MSPESVLALVGRFHRNREAYKSAGYNETQRRREFLDPFFKALGWDIDNEQGYADAYKDVIHEDAIKIGEATKAPDYCFRIGGARKFFLEAKKPAVDIKNDASPAYQLRRYAWTTKLPLSILSDFEEFAVYDCRVKPDQKDKASVARILYIPYTESCSCFTALRPISLLQLRNAAFSSFSSLAKLLILLRTSPSLERNMACTSEQAWCFWRNANNSFTSFNAKPSSCA